MEEPDSEGGESENPALNEFVQSLLTLTPEPQMVDMMSATSDLKSWLKTYAARIESEAGERNLLGLANESDMHLHAHTAGSIQLKAFDRKTRKRQHPIPWTETKCGKSINDANPTCMETSLSLWDVGQSVTAQSGDEVNVGEHIIIYEDRHVSVRAQHTVIMLRNKLAEAEVFSGIK